MEAAEGSLILRQEIVPLALTRKEVLKFSGFVLLFLFLMALWLGFGERGFIHLYKMEKERQAYVQKIQNRKTGNCSMRSPVSVPTGSTSSPRAEENWASSEMERFFTASRETGKQRTRENRDTPSDREE